MVNDKQQSRANHEREDILTKFARDGYYFPIKVLSPAEAFGYRKMLEAEENNGKYDDQEKLLLYKSPNFVLPFVDKITRLPAILEPVQAILGPNLLVFETVFFIKEADTPHFVSWHQDLTYWGLDELSEVTAWVALTPATTQSGCMQFVPGSHHNPIGEHHDTFEEINMLSRGQVLSKEVREEETIDIVLQPGELSLHHGRMFHSSPANRSADRRIGLAIRYISPEMKLVSGEKRVVRLVAGEDTFDHFERTAPPSGVMNEADKAVAARNNQVRNRINFKGAARRISGAGSPLRSTRARF